MSNWWQEIAERKKPKGRILSLEISFSPLLPVSSSVNMLCNGEFFDACWSRGSVGWFLCFIAARCMMQYGNASFLQCWIPIGVVCQYGCEDRFFIVLFSFLYKYIYIVPGLYKICNMQYHLILRFLTSKTQIFFHL